MNDKDLIHQILRSNNGIIEARQASEAGINNKTLQRLHQSGDLERIEHGIYIDPNYIEDVYYITQLRCKQSIYSHETALYFHELTNRTPFQLQLTIPSGYNTRLIQDKEKYKFYYIKRDLFEIGKIKMESPFGNPIRVYDKERTICDVLKKKDKLDADLVSSAIKYYIKEPGNDFSKLLTYAELFKIKDIVRQYLEVLV